MEEDMNPNEEDASSLTATQRTSPELASLHPRLFSVDFEALQNLWDTLPEDFDPETLSRLLNSLQMQQNQVNTVMYGKVMAQYEAMGRLVYIDELTSLQNWHSSVWKPLPQF